MRNRLRDVNYFLVKNGGYILYFFLAQVKNHSNECLVESIYLDKTPFIK